MQVQALTPDQIRRLPPAQRQAVQQVIDQTRARPPAFLPPPPPPPSAGGWAGRPPLGTPPHAPAAAAAYLPSPGTPSDADGRFSQLDNMLDALR